MEDIPDGLLYIKMQLQHVCLCDDALEIPFANIGYIFILKLFYDSHRINCPMKYCGIGFLLATAKA